MSFRALKKLAPVGEARLTQQITLFNTKEPTPSQGC
jgi:hypothetical protein